VDARVHWAGARPAAGRLFAAFDAFVLSSRTEGTPMVLFEAIDAGVPVIATAVGGVPDVVGSEHAWLVPSEDPSALARAMVEALTDRATAARRSDEARRRLRDRFGLEPWLDAYDRIYREIARSAVTRAGDRAAP
jgi:glycosyltransferase involved in cell wall biosynthesis